MCECTEKRALDYQELELHGVSNQVGVGHSTRVLGKSSVCSSLQSSLHSHTLRGPHEKILHKEGPVCRKTIPASTTQLRLLPILGQPTPILLSFTN